MRPEEGDAEGSVGPLERSLQALLVVDVRGDDLRAERLQLLCLVGAGGPGQRAHGESAALVAQDGTGQPAPLGPGRTHHCDDLLIRHCGPPSPGIRPGQAAFSRMSKQAAW